VVEQNIQIIRIQQRVLRRSLHQIIRVGHDVLVKRRRGRDIEHDGRSLAPPGAPRLLPRARDCSRIAAQHARIQRADVDAQLQRVRGHHRVHPSRAKSAFNLSPLCRQIPAAIAAHPPGVPQRVAHHVLQVLRQHLNRQPRPRERNRLNSILQQQPRNPPRLLQNALADAQLPIDHRRIVEHEVPHAHRRAVIIHQADLAPRQRFRQFLRVRNRRAAQDELRMTAVEIAQAQQPPQHVRQIRPKHAAIGMNFINHDIPQVFKQLDPLRVVRQNPAVQHIRVRHDDMPRLPNRLSRRAGRIAVIGIRLDINAHRLNQLIQFADLISRQRFRRKEVQCPCIIVLQNGRQHRQVIAHRFAGGRRRDNHNIPPCQHLSDCVRLMAIQLMHPAFFQHRKQPRIKRIRERLIHRRTRRKDIPTDNILHKHRVTAEGFRQLVNIHRKHLPTRIAFPPHDSRFLFACKGEQGGEGRIGEKKKGINTRKNYGSEVNSIARRGQGAIAGTASLLGLGATPQPLVV